MKNNYKSAMREIINRTAEKLYKDLNLEPGFNISDVITKLGGTLEFEAKSHISVYPKNSGNNFKIIHPFENLDDVYVRFDIAHELGHLFLHMTELDKDGNYHINSTYTKKRDICIMEWEAMEFAASFLMPESIFYIKVELVYANENIKDKIQCLADIFKVPYKSVIIRGKSLDIFN